MPASGERPRRARAPRRNAAPPNAKAGEHKTADFLLFLNLKFDETKCKFLEDLNEKKKKIPV